MRTKKTTTQKTTDKPIVQPVDIKTEDISKLTFALDIGTRSVVGIIGINENSIFNVIDYEQKLHTKRAMRDGQIEDIACVADIVKDVKEALEKRHNITLKSVSIAAAGRALKTKKITYEQELNPTEEINEKLLQAIEFCAIGMAQDEFLEEKENINVSFYCVGYSIINYKLDEYQISNLIGHKGNKVTVELIAAFLPHNVVQSLYTVMNINNLSVDSLTLEPIAAINVIVPPDIRLLNIALVDIGAGTSDIAISQKGSIVAYDMVTIAGDEITEDIMEKYVTNFETAEQIKISLGEAGEDIEFKDIMGNPRTENKKKILKTIRPSINALSESISKRILEINKTAPLAMFMVGGGSQIPELCTLIAQQLKMQPNYVAVGGKQEFKNIKLFTDKLQNPEFITPLGIGALSSVYKGCDFFSISVNGKKVMLLNYGNSKVIDALLLSSIKPQNLIGISSRPVVYFLNGEKFIKRGSNSVPGELYVNDQPASIDTKIKQGDEIVAKQAVNGTPAEIKIIDVRHECTPFTVTVDNIEMQIEPEFYIGSKKLSDKYTIQSMDEINVVYPSDLKQLNEKLELDIDFENYEILINSNPAFEETIINSGDEIHIMPKNEYIKVAEAEKLLDLENTENNEDLEQNENTKNNKNLEQNKNIENNENLEQNKSETTQSEYDTLPDGSIRVCINDEWQTIFPSDKNKLFFFDMLNYVDIDPQKPQGNIILKLNGIEASYTAPIKNGDVIVIKWDKK